MFREVATDGRADPAGFDADLVGDNAIDAVEQIAGQTTVAWKTRGADGIVALPFGDFPAGFALDLCAMEMVVHTWDLATATNQLVAWDEDLVTNALDFAHATFTSSESRGANFAPPVSVDEGGATIERLVGFLGRH